MNRPFRVLSAMALLWCLAAPVRAQVGQAELRGTVVDESGAVLPGVTLTATHVDTGTVRTTVTTSTGSYVMPALPVGAYTIKAELTGFGGITKEGVRLGVGESGTLNFTLKVATLAENFTVSGE
jgi:type 1 fimbria pilin